MPPCSTWPISPGRCWPARWRPASPRSAAVGVLLALTAAAVIIIGARSRRGDAGRAGRPARARRPALGVLHSVALRRLLLTGALVNLALSATEVALTGYVRDHHALWASGPLLAEVSVGSIVGSLLLGARASAAEAADGARRLPRLLARYALGLAVLTGAGLYAPLVAVAAPLAGFCLGPSLATLFGLASSAAPDGGGYRGAVVAELGDERRRGRRRGPGRRHRQPAVAVPGCRRRGRGGRRRRRRALAPGQETAA